MKGFNLYRAILVVILIIFLTGYDDKGYAEETPLISSERKFNIAIFKEEDFPAIGTTPMLNPEWLYSSLSRYFSVIYLDFPKLSNRRYLNIDNFDLLILPYGEAFPYKAFVSIREYLFEGGGLLNIAGRPFWVAMGKIEGRWQKVDINGPYKEFLSPLGIKYYEVLDNEDIGLSVTTSLAATPITPTHGNVFPYRIPVRDFSNISQSIVLVKSWRNPYVRSSQVIPQKWCLIGAKGDNHPLDPQNPLAENTLIQIMECLSSPLIIYELETDLAAYHQKEKVRVSVKVMNYGKVKERCIVEFEFVDETGKLVYKKGKAIELEAGQRKTLNEIWEPGEFSSDFYRVTAILKKKGEIYDKEENGFVVVDEDILRNGPLIQIKGNKFLIDGKTSYLLGINYYESKLGELMWLGPNIHRIREDFKSMRTLGINFVRIHYHHSKWFRDYFSQVIKDKIPSYFQAADTKALPSERSLRILDAIIQLAQEQGLILCIDIFSLVPKEMGDPIGWLGLKERILDRKKIAAQKEFVEVLAHRYKGVPGITWDLWNEPRLEEVDYQPLRNWAKDIKEVLRKGGDNHPITIGDDLSLSLLDVLDYASIHSYDPQKFSFLKGLSKPFIFQETWNDAGCSLNDEIRQAQKLKEDFEAFLKTEAVGFVPWQWTRQARLWNNTCNAEKWDDELGVCVHDDGTLKPAGKVYFSLIGLVSEDKNSLIE